MRHTYKKPEEHLDLQRAVDLSSDLFTNMV